MRYLCSLFLLPVCLVWAQEATETPGVMPEPLSASERQYREARIQTLKDEANRLQGAAESRWKNDQALCYEKFFVNTCLDEAKQVYIQSMSQARQLEQEGRQLELSLKQYDAAIRAAERASTVAEREAKLNAQGAAFRAEEARKAEVRAAKLAEKERQAIEGRKKLEAEAAERAKKQAERAHKASEVTERQQKNDASAVP